MNKGLLPPVAAGSIADTLPFVVGAVDPAEVITLPLVVGVIVVVGAVGPVGVFVVAGTVVVTVVIVFVVEGVGVGVGVVADPVGIVTVSASKVTAVCAINLPFTVAPVFTTIAVCDNIIPSKLEVVPRLACPATCQKMF